MSSVNNFPAEEDITFFLKEMAKRDAYINIWEQDLANKSKSNLAQIKRAVQAGNEAAFTPFFQKNYYKLYYSLIGKIKSKEKTEDIVMEVIYKFYNKFLVLNQPIPDNPSGYLYRMANNLWIDSLKTKNDDELEEFKEPIEIDYLTKSEEIENKKLMDKALQIAWSEFDLKSQNMLTDRIVHEMPLEEIKVKYGFETLNSTSSALSQRKRRLKNRGNKIYNDLNK